MLRLYIDRYMKLFKKVSLALWTYFTTDSPSPLEKDYFKKFKKINSFLLALDFYILLSQLLRKQSARDTFQIEGEGGGERDIKTVLVPLTV